MMIAPAPAHSPISPEFVMRRGTLPCVQPYHRRLRRRWKCGAVHCPSVQRIAPRFTARLPARSGLARQRSAGQKQRASRFVWRSIGWRDAKSRAMAGPRLPSFCFDVGRDAFSLVVRRGHWPAGAIPAAPASSRGSVLAGAQIEGTRRGCAVGKSACSTGPRETVRRRALEALIRRGESDPFVRLGSRAADPNNICGND